VLILEELQMRQGTNSALPIGGYYMKKLNLGPLHENKNVALRKPDRSSFRIDWGLYKREDWLNLLMTTTEPNFGG